MPPSRTPVGPRSRAQAGWGHGEGVPASRPPGSARCPRLQPGAPSAERRRERRRDPGSREASWGAGPDRTGEALQECARLSSRWEAPCGRARPERARPSLHGSGARQPPAAELTDASFPPDGPEPLLRCVLGGTAAVGSHAASQSVLGPYGWEEEAVTSWPPALCSTSCGSAPAPLPYPGSRGPLGGPPLPHGSFQMCKG